MFSDEDLDFYVFNLLWTILLSKLTQSKVLKPWFSFQITSVIPNKTFNCLCEIKEISKLSKTQEEQNPGHCQCALTLLFLFLWQTHPAVHIPSDMGCAVRFVVKVWGPEQVKAGEHSDDRAPFV